ncbi:MAG: FtsX-like permease family protein [Bacteroidales bacterium]|nr:FtsX-like permease family protein [Bacteroidales bacterium]
MIKNSLFNFFRKIGKGDIHSLINLGGLSVGLATCLLIYLYIADELSYDRHHTNASQIYRLLERNPQTGDAAAIMPGRMYDYLEGRLPGVQEIVRIFQLSESVLTVDDQAYIENGLLGTDQEIFDVLTFEFLAGDPSTALSEPYALVLTESAALKYFGDNDPMGQRLMLYNEVPLTVTGLIKDSPRQSHLEFSMLTHISAVELISPTALQDWDISSIYLYFLLEAHADAEHVTAEIQRLIWEAHEAYKDRRFYYLQPLLDVRLYSANVDWDLAVKGNINTVIIFSVTAILILFLACFNFVNLSTATAMKRHKEVGIRKVLGANRAGLMKQFLLETFVFGIFAMIIALLLVELLLPFLNNLSGKEMTQQFFAFEHFFFAVILLVLAVPLLAGMYPALIMSRYQAIAAIKGNTTLTSIKGLKNKSYQLRLRQVLLLLQFAVSIALIVGSLMIYRQMRYLSESGTGYNRENLLVIRNPWDRQSMPRAHRIRELMLQHTDVQKVSLSHNVPTQTIGNYTNYTFEASDGRRNVFGAVISCDVAFFETMETRLLRGRDFLPDMPTELTASTVINETMARRLGTDNPIGINLGGFYDGQTRQVVGVVEDIKFSSMHESVIPMAFFISPEAYPANWLNIVVRHDAGKAAAVLSYLESFWPDEAPGWPLQYFFIEDRLQAQYADERRVMHIVGSFAGLAVFLSALGIVGLAYFSANSRTREIGIRKVLGASITKIVRMLSNEFGILAIAANLLALPVAWYFISRWLDTFAYRTDMHWLVFAIPAVFVFLLAWTVVGLISYRAALLNPTDSIRAT